MLLVPPALLLVAALAPQVAGASISAPERGDQGLLIHRIRCPYQEGETQLRVLLPDPVQPGRHYPVVYVLPVEAHREHAFGDGLQEIRRQALHCRYQAIFVSPTFSHLPWYADHPSRPELRQESYFLRVVVPAVEKGYPAQANASGRLLLGFSKSGWGAFAILLRNPETFGKAAVWDSPLMMQRPDRYRMAEVFATQENFELYRISRLLKERALQLQAEPRLILLGYSNFREHGQKAHALMIELGIAHEYRDGPARAHDWQSGWVSEAVQRLLSEAGESKPAIAPAPHSSTPR